MVEPSASRHQEIERKFLLNGDGWRQHVTASEEIIQGYLHADARAAIRVRLKDGKGYLTLKASADASGVENHEFEYPIPAADVDAIIGAFCAPVIRKTRHLVPAGQGRQWEIDEFHAPHEGLVMAEIELGSRHESFVKPAWIGQEVTGRAEYTNGYLSSHEGVPQPPQAQKGGI